MSDEIVLAMGKQRAFIKLDDMVLKAEIPGGDPSKIMVGDIRDKAMSGDMELVFDKVTGATLPTSDAWEVPITVTLETEDGKLHTWFNATFEDVFTAANTSVAGSAAMKTNRHAVFVNGVCNVALTGDAEDWLDTEEASATLTDLTIMGTTVTGRAFTLTFEAAP